MKTRLIYFSMIMLALASCAKVQEEVIDSPEEVTPVSGKSIVVNAVIPETKVTISEDGDAYKMSWDGDEAAKLLERYEALWKIKGYDSKSAAVSGDGIAFSFDLNIEDDTKGYGYDIIYPQAGVVSDLSGYFGGMKVILQIPASQTPKASTPDPNAVLLRARVDGVFPTQPSSVNATFGHLSAYGKMNLKGISSEETITSIAIEAEDCDVAGNLEYYAMTGQGKVSDLHKTTGNTLTLSGTNLTADPAGFDVWFACKPFTLEAGKTLTIVATTSAGVHTSVLSAKVDIVFSAGVVTEFPATADIYTVIFDTQGGSVVAPVSVKKGQKVSEPSAPTKAVDLVQGLYPGDIDPDYATFGGWYTDPECTEPYDFDTAITESFTLYAKWTVPEQIDPETVKWINQGFDYAKDNAGTYTFVLTSNATSGAVLTLNNASSTIVVAGKGSERIISSTVNWQAAIRAQSGTVILANNATVTNTAGPAAMLADGGNIIMRAGSKVKDCSVSPTSSYTDVRGVVYINNASSTFTLDGGEITNNTMTGVSNDYLAATVCANNGNIVINSGSITNNTVTRSTGSASVGGAICLPYRNDGAVLRKTGGVISGNSVVDESGENNRIGQQLISYTLDTTRHYYTIDDAIGEEVTFEAIDFSSPIWTLVDPL